MKSIKTLQKGQCRLSDLAGKWKGVARSQGDSITLQLDVNAQGKVNGSGVRAEWDIDSQGRVRGGGSFAFLRKSTQIVVKATWEMNLDLAGKTLSGNFHIADELYNDCVVHLKKLS